MYETSLKDKLEEIAEIAPFHALNEYFVKEKAEEISNVFPDIPVSDVEQMVKDVCGGNTVDDILFLSPWG